MNVPVSMMRPVCGLLLAGLLACLACAPARADEAGNSPVKDAAMNAFWEGDFSELERMNAVFRQPGQLEANGASRIDIFRQGLDQVFSNEVANVEPYLLELDRLTLQWATDHPKSAFAHILHAKSLVAHGWSYRGGSYAREVPADAMKEFVAYQQRAAAYLKAHADVALTDSFAHDTLLEIGRGLGWDSRQMIAIANAGLQRNPEDADLHFSVVGTLLPKWGGNARLLDSYINDATRQTSSQFGAGMYARLYSAAAKNQYGHALFEDSLADWPRMKQGFDDMLARFPDSPNHLNRYAYMACIAKDRETLVKLLARIGDAVDTSEWGGNPERVLEGCRSWAAAK